MSDSINNNQLSPDEQAVLLHKATEPPFSGAYHDFYKNGIYQCRQCNALLYRSMDKFNSGCGWPSFDDEIPGAIQRVPDADGQRTEIICQNCSGHLGHVFTGEQFTNKNTRHCVNSLSMRFISFEQLLEQTPANIGKIIVAAGCFWGVEYFYEQAPGVLATACGYTGGTIDYPSYRQVCSGTTGHAEAVAIIFTKDQTNEYELLDLLFDIHDATQKNRQGPDIGTQYRSALFPVDQQQQALFKQYLTDYQQQSQEILATTIEPYTKFWLAEADHQKYFSSRQQAPSCHYRRSKST